MVMMLIIKHQNRKIPSECKHTKNQFDKVNQVYRKVLNTILGLIDIFKNTLRGACIREDYIQRAFCVSFCVSTL